MKISKVIYLSLFVIFCAVLVGVSYEQMVDARPNRNQKGNTVGTGIIIGGLGGATVGSIATGGSRSGTLAGLGVGIGVGALAGAGSYSNNDIDEDNFDYDSDECDYCD
ncbi:hypothetical protein Noda2021_02580 [Candidatus Dependentiae bacterium Noda2021]|nr:hypothetical protein Noda2021_02580 [Candidatus Dependentiae bacterium Noda2021]